MDTAPDEPIELPTEGGVERSVLRWLSNIPGLPDFLQWTVWDPEDGEGAAVLDNRYDRDKGEVIYWNLLREQLIQINEEVTEENAGPVITALRREMSHDGLMAGNKHLHRLLLEGQPFEPKRSNGTTKRSYARLIDFQHPERNRFDAASQMRVTRGHSIRPDVTLLVNGIPLVQMELKSLAQDNDYTDAIEDLGEYEEKVPRFFYPTLLNVAADTEELRYGAVGAPEKFYFPWPKAPGRFEAEGQPMKQATWALLNPPALLDILQGYVFYERGEGGDAKIVPRHMQYYATQEILGRIEEGTDEDGSRKEGAKTRGLVWHTQGSGKSYTMLFAAKLLLERQPVPNPQVFILVDTDKLARQMADNLSAIGFDRSVVCRKISHLQEVIEKGNSQLVLTTMHAFEDVDPGVQSNPNVVVMADEAHRFMEKELGSRLRAALPEAWNFGFTGTPVHEGYSEAARNTFREYCPGGEDPLHHYSIREGLEDGVIVPVFFTLRHEAEWDIGEEAMDEEFEEAFAEKRKDEKLCIIRESLTQSELGQLEPRVQTYAEVAVDHFEKKVEPNGWKGMVVAPSRLSAAMYGEHIKARRADPSDTRILYTSGEGDPQRIRQFGTSKEERGEITRRFRKEENPKLLVVHQMLLTGFDAPVLKTMYLDRRLQDHTLLQAIARTNRPAEGKSNGEIVDFQGTFANLDDALHYDEEVVEAAAQSEEKLFEKFEAQLEAVFSLFDGIEKTNSQEAVQEALARVSKHPERRQFKQGYKRLQDLYESVSPDKRLMKPRVKDRYGWLSGIWVAFNRAENREEDPEENVREKTLQIVEDHVDVGQVKKDFPIYKVGEEHLGAIEGQKPATKASSIAATTKAHLRPKVGQNPRYERLSGRVEEVLSQWKSGQIADPEAVDALEELEREVVSVEEEADEKGFSGAEYATYALLHDGYGFAEERAHETAETLCRALDQEVDTSFEGWWENEKAQRKVKVQIYKTLAQTETPEGLDKRALGSELRDYLIANYANRHTDGSGHSDGSESDR
jgi:type I restriction enzyme R subunit